MTDLFMHGIQESGLTPKVTVISDELEAIEYAMEHAEIETFIYWAVDDVDKATKFMRKEEKKIANSLEKNRITYDPQGKTADYWRS